MIVRCVIGSKPIAVKGDFRLRLKIASARFMLLAAKKTAEIQAFHRHDHTPAARYRGPQCQTKREERTYYPAVRGTHVLRGMRQSIPSSSLAS